MHAIALAAQDLTGVLGRPSQHDLLAARQMQAMSFAFHIPLVCFGIAFPAMVLFVEGLWLRTGDATYRDLARRWSKALVVLFAVGVVTGTILSFELGLLWPNFMATFGSVFGLAFAIEGFAFFTEAIFIAMYVYSWDRVGPRVHLAMGLPIALAGIVGSLMVISVNGWMNHPTGFTVSGAGVSDVHPWAALFNSHLPYELVHMYLAGYMVAGSSSLPSTRARYCAGGTTATSGGAGRSAHGGGAGRARAGRGRRLGGPDGGTGPNPEARRHGGHRAARSPTRPCTSAGSTSTARCTPASRSRACSRCSRTTTSTRPWRASTPFRRPIARPSTSSTSRSTRWSASARSSRSWGSAGSCSPRAGGCRARRGSTGAVIVAAPLSLIALLAGWTTTEVGRQPWIAWQVMRTTDAVTSARGLPFAYAFLALVYTGLTIVAVWLLRRVAREEPTRMPSLPASAAPRRRSPTSAPG